MSKRKRQRLSIDGQSATTAFHDVDILQQNDQTSGTRKIKSLFVHSLPANTTTEHLTAHFSQSFPIKHATMVVDPVTHQSKGYGFVTFADAKDAQTARETLNGSTYQGKKIRVELAEPRHRASKEDNDPGHGTMECRTGPSKLKRRRGLDQPESKKSSKLIVRNLPWSIKESEQLAHLFRSFGKVKFATVPKKPSGLSAGYGFVVLRGNKNAEKAMNEMNGREIDGRHVAVDFAVEKVEWEILHVKGHDEPANAEGPEGFEENDSVKFEIDNITDVDEVATSEENQIHGSSAKSALSNYEEVEKKAHVSEDTDTSSTLFIRNVSFDATDEMISEHFTLFGPIRYGRVVIDSSTEKSRGTAFVSFCNAEDANKCLRDAPKSQSPSSQAVHVDKAASSSLFRRSLLENTSIDPSGNYTLQGRVLQVSRAVGRGEAKRLTVASRDLRESNDKDKRHLYLLSEGTISANSPLYDQLPPSEHRMREDSAKQRQTLIKSNPALHLSLTRLSIRNVPRSMTSKELKELARKAVVGFASDVKAGIRQPLSKEELARGAEESREAEKVRKTRGKGIVRQAKIVFEGVEGGKVREDSGAGRSRGYGFIEYTSHRCALMGLRWLNGHPVEAHRSQDTDVNGPRERKKRLIIEFAIENAQVVGRRREREAIARERSKTTFTERMSGHMQHAKFGQHATANALKGTKSSHEHAAGSVRPQVNKPREKVNSKAEALSRRQQIVARKRKVRQSNKKACAIGRS